MAFSFFLLKLNEVVFALISSHHHVSRSTFLRVSHLDPLHHDFTVINHHLAKSNMRLIDETTVVHEIKRSPQSHSSRLEPEKGSVPLSLSLSIFGFVH